MFLYIFYIRDFDFVYLIYIEIRNLYVVGPRDGQSRGTLRAYLDFVAIARTSFLNVTNIYIS
jgi:hypothetical protein